MFAQRVAPVQINYLGYPGSMGAPYIDYIIADATVIPQEYESLYAERVIRLPETFQVNDSQRAIAAVQPRTAYGLPDKGIVLASFNTSYKLNPVMFTVVPYIKGMSRCSALSVRREPDSNCKLAKRSS